MALKVDTNRRLQLGLLLSVLLVAVVMAVVVVQELRAPWRRLQAQYLALGVDEAFTGIREINTPHGRVDRCATCHLGSLAATAPVTVKLEPHPPFARGHEPERLGCTVCHGGTGRALNPDVAHALPGTGDRDPLLEPPYIEASCSQCHVPGAVAGSERVARGAELYLSLGCAMCHPLAPGGRGGWDFGPDLRSLARQSPTQLRTSLFEPTADYPRSTMPSYETSLDRDQTALTDLLAFVQALSLTPLEQPADARVTAPCVDCHSGSRGLAGGRLEHRCTYIKVRPQLVCAGCHDPEVPAGRFCPLIIEHREACRACHWQSRTPGAGAALAGSSGEPGEQP